MSSKQEQEQAPTGPRLMGELGIARDHIDLIKTAVDGSPTKVAVVGVRMADGREGFSKFDFKNAEPFDHVLIVYYDSNKQDYVVGEMMPGDKPGSESDYGRLFGSSSTPGTLEEVVGQWHKFVAVPVTLTPEQDALLRSSAEKNLSAGNTYSFLSEQGNTCASGVRKVLLDAKVWDWSEQGFWAQLEKAGLNIVQPGTVVEWAAQRGGVIYDSHGYLRSHSSDVTEEGPVMDARSGESAVQTATAEKETYVNFKTMFQDAWDNFRETYPDAADYLAELLLELAGREPTAWGAARDVKFGIPDILLPKAVAAEALQGLWDDFSEAFPEEAEALAEYLIKTYGEPGPFGSYSFQLKAAIPIMLDKFVQPASDGQAGSSSEQPASVHEDVANASANDGAHTPTAEKETYVNFKTMLQDGWDNFRETYPDAAEKLGELLLQLADQEPSFMGAAADVKFGIPDIVLPKAVAAEALQGLWDDFSEAFPEAAEALAEHLVKTYGEPAPFGSYSFQLKAAIPMMLDKLAQPAPDQAGSSSEQPASVHEDVPNASADDGAHIGDVSAMAKAELVINPALDNQPAPQLATSAPVIQDDRFSFSMFTKQGIVQGDVAKEVMPAGQLSPQDSGSGVPAGESAHPDVGTEDVGNAAPTKDHVVHHGDLAP
jgi:hypothetical protein